jgi:hypothetical protein
MLTKQILATEFRALSEYRDKPAHGWNEQVVGMVESYDPAHEFVVMLFEALDGHRSYWVEPVVAPPTAYDRLGPELFPADF